MRALVIGDVKDTHKQMYEKLKEQGVEVDFVSADKLDKIRGREYSHVFIDEMGDVSDIIPLQAPEKPCEYFVEDKRPYYRRFERRNWK